MQVAGKFDPARTTTRGGHIPALDGLRTLAVGLVLLYHLSARVAPGGNVGVDIFFVLSGLLITRVLLREWNASGRISLAAFYMRRLLRLMPALVVMVGIDTAYELLFGGPDPHFLPDAAMAVLYLMDFVEAFTRYVDWSAISHTWSLAVEEHFYLIWPLLLIGLGPLAARLRMAVVIALTVLLIAWRTHLVLNGASYERTYFGFDTRSDQLLAGCLLALWLDTNPMRALVLGMARLWPLALAAILAVSFLPIGAGTLVRIGQPVVVSASSCVIILALMEPRGILPRLASMRLPVLFGQLSYGIYLWHWPILNEVRFHTGSQAAALAAIIASVGVAALSYRYVEQPMLRLKSRFEFHGAARPAAATEMDATSGAA